VRRTTARASVVVAALLVATLTYADPTCADEEPAQKPVLVARPPDVGRPSYRGSFGYGKRTIFDIPMSLYELEVGGGERRRHEEAFGAAGLAWGRTAAGLPVLHGRFTAAAQLHESIFAFGGGLRLGYLRIGKVAESGSFNAMTFGLLMLVTIDVVPIEDHALFVEGRLTADALIGGDQNGNGIFGVGPMLYGWNVACGVRW
jgi:hypothetical protein